jgi:YD repeat-containing protein
MPPLRVSLAQTLSVVTAIVIFCLTDQVARAQQVNPATETGVPPYGTFFDGSFDNVQLPSGNLHIEIPIFSVRERGRTFNFKYIYDPPSFQKVWVPTPTQQNKNAGYYTVSQVMDDSGWRLSHPFRWTSSYVQVTTTCPTTGLKYTYSDKFYLEDPDGTKHQFALYEEGNGTQSACYGQTLSGPALDGSGIVWNLQTNIATEKDGTQINLSTGTITDANGNEASLSADMLGRNIITTTNGSGTTTWTYVDSNGNSHSYQVQLASYNIQTNFCSKVYTCYEYSGTMSLPTKLTLPDNTTYQFSYENDSLGQLQEIVLPTGGSITYEDTSISTTQPDTGTHPTYVYKAAVSSRTLSTGTVNYPWTYSGITGANVAAVTVTDPLGNQQVHEFSPVTVNNVSSASPVETSVSYYQGTTSGKLLRTVARAWAGEEYLPVSSLATIVNLRTTSVTTTLDNGQENQVQTDYETFTFDGQTFTRMNPTEVREYDYGNGAPGPLLRRTDYTYLHTNNQTYVNLNIVDRITSTTTYNGSGTLLAQTQSEFDNYTQGIASTNSVQHSSSYGSAYTTRGNLTAVEKWRNTDGSWLTTRHQYNDVGDAVATTDPNGNTTQYSYSDSWGNSTCAPTGGSANAFVTKITNALNQTSLTMSALSNRF